MTIPLERRSSDLFQGRGIPSEGASIHHNNPWKIGPLPSGGEKTGIQVLHRSPKSEGCMAQMLWSETRMNKKAWKLL
ncbi:UNVERIFIED_CONTAM: hypothetical protein K2H54_068207 [Gekko kuhli]